MQYLCRRLVPGLDLHILLDKALLQLGHLVFGEGETESLERAKVGHGQDSVVLRGELDVGKGAAGLDGSVARCTRLLDWLLHLNAKRVDGLSSDGDEHVTDAVRGHFSLKSRINRWMRHNEKSSNSWSNRAISDSDDIGQYVME